MPYSPRAIPVSSADQHSLAATGTATAPGAGAALATIAAPPVGMYRVRAEVCLIAGAPAAAEDTNVQIRRAAAEVKRLVLGRTLGTEHTAEVVVQLDGAQALSVNAVAAATAGVVYGASISATKIR